MSAPLLGRPAYDMIAHRVLGALRFVDATTGVNILAPLNVTAPGASFVRNLTGAYVVTSAPGLDAYTREFQEAPGEPAGESVALRVSVGDRARHYLARTATLLLPRDPDPAHAAAAGSVFRAVLVQLYPAPIAAIEPGWAVVRASVHDGAGTALAGAYLRLRRASQATETDPPLARGMADARGEALVAVAGVPVTNWDAEDDGPVLSSDVDAVLEVYYDPNAGSPPDPDLIDSRRLLPPQNPNALRRASVNVRLTSGRERTVSVVIAT